MTWLRPHLDHGILELDTNTAERAMRSIAIGGKNDLFVGSRTRGRAAAIAHTLIETAKPNGIDPQAWLADTLARIPDYKSTASTICCHERPQRKASTPSLTPDVMGGGAKTIEAKREWAQSLSLAAKRAPKQDAPFIFKTDA